MKLRRNKKGFTIIELVIVIAVIGILTAILVPVFINLTARANEAADDSLVKNLNTALKMEEVLLDNPKNETLQDAIDDLEAEGYILENLISKSGKDLLWNQPNNEFVLNKEGTYSGKDYWQIVDKMPTEQKYSYYAGKQFKDTTVSPKYGFDAGNNDNIESVNYTHKPTSASEKESVAIRTNGGSLTVDAPYDVVNHYGNANTLNIIAVANASYHENGNVKFVEISQGRIVLEQKAEVKHIHVNAIAPVNPEAKATAFEEIIIAKAQQVEMPVLSRDDVEIAATGTLVVALQDGTSETADKDFVWLTKQGIYEQIKVSDTPDINDSTWVDSSDKSDETKAAAQQIANNIDRDSEGKVNSTVTIDNEDYSVGFDEDRNMIFTQDNPIETVDSETGNKTIEQKTFIINDDGEITSTTTTTVKNADDQVISEQTSAPAAVEAQEIKEDVSKGVDESVEKVASKEDVEKGATLFAGGKGTEKDPYIIYNYETMQNISKLYNEGYYYFEVDLSRTDNGKIDCLNNWNSVLLNGSFNGNGVAFTNLNNRLFSNIKGGELSTICNFNIVSCYIVGDYSSGVCNNVLADHVLFENINITGYIEGNSWAASFISYAGNYGKKMTLSFKDCESSADLVSAESCAGFIAHPGNIGTYSDSRIEIIDSKFVGSITHKNTSAYYVAYNYVTEKILYFKYSDNYDYSGIYTLGVPSALSEKDENGFQHYNNTVNNGFNGGGIYYTKTNSVAKLNRQEIQKPAKYEHFSIEALANTTNATFIWTIGFTASTGGTNWTGGYISENVEKDANGYVTSTFKYYDLTLNGSSTTTTGLAADGKTFNVVNPVYIGQPDSNYVTVTEYNAAGAVLRITIINLK